jgi:hypothetical protein
VTFTKHRWSRAIKEFFVVFFFILRAPHNTLYNLIMKRRETKRHENKLQTSNCFIIFDCRSALQIGEMKLLKKIVKHSLLIESFGESQIVTDFEIAQSTWL